MHIKTAFTLLPFVVLLLELFVFVRKVSSRTRTQAIWTMILLFSASKFLIFASLGGDAFAPELPSAVIWTLNVFYSSFMILLPLSLLARLCRVKGKGLYVCAALSAFIALIGIYNGARAPILKEVELKFANLPEELDGYRIVQLSDLHVSAAEPDIRGIVERVNELKADLICVTGDLVDGEFVTQAKHLEPIRLLEAKDGVYFVTGNHEYYTTRHVWAKLFDHWGLKFLVNECVFPRPTLALGGVNDSAAERFHEPMPVPAKAFDKATHGEFRILLSHRPAHARDNITAIPVDLQLSGHTHGGVMPVLDRLIARVNGGFSKGVYPLGRGCLYLSPGTGQWAGFPIRFFNPREITLLTLRRE